MKKVFLMFCCCVVIIACKGVPHTVALEKNAKMLHVEMQEMIADRSCDADEQCHAIGIGARACGGFDNFDVYSSKNLDRADVTKKADIIFNQSKKENAENGMASICSIEIEPKTKCLAQQCVIDVMASLPAETATE